MIYYCFIDVVLVFVLLTFNTFYTFYSVFAVDFEQVNASWEFIISFLTSSLETP